MPEQSDLDRRLRAVERALTDGDHDVAALREAGEMADRLDDHEDRIATLEDRVAEQDAALQAVRGYVGNVRSVNDDVADRADAALAAVDRIETRLDEFENDAPRDASTTSGPEPNRESASEPVADTRSPDGPTRNPSNNGHASETGDRPHRLADDVGSIEMPVPDAESASSNSTATEEDEEPSVIQRVREAL